MRRILMGLALAVSLAIPSSALAAASSGSTESLTEVSAFTLTGVPATITYPNQVAGVGGNVTAPDLPSITFGAAGSGAVFDVTGTNITSSGNTTIANSARGIAWVSRSAGGAQSGGQFDSAAGAFGGFPSTPSSAMLIANIPAGSSTDVVLRLRVTVPVGQGVGVYTGSLTFSVH